MLIGATDDDWVITGVSSEVERSLGIPPQQALGQRLTDLVEPGDVQRMQAAAVLAAGDSAVCLAVGMPNAAPGWTRPACVLASLAATVDRGAATRAFILVRLDDWSTSNESRAARLERHLWNIAAEVEASGILEDLAHVPNAPRLQKMEMLSVRQWDIVLRLLRGDRVPQIASDLFVSQSTVRNHLSQVFERFGVHSQAELLTMLRSEMDTLS